MKNKEVRTVFGMLKSKKGFNTIVTIFAILLLITTFIIFIYLFKVGAERKEGEIDSKFSSIQSEYVLKTFLRSPAPMLGSRSASDLTPDVGESVTNADLVSWTCTDNKSSTNYKILGQSINTFFDKLYADEWEVWIIYSNPDTDRRAFGHRSILEKIRMSISTRSASMEGVAESFPVTGEGGTASNNSDERHTALAQALAGSFKQEGFGFQIVPCQDGSFSAVMLKAQVIILKPYSK
jgi:hypothetical protein